MNVIFSLLGLARTWFVNHEKQLGDWDTFYARFRDLFDRPASRTADATHRLSFSAQKIDEDYRSYIEDVLALCKRVDTSMSDSQELKNITEGIREYAFQIIIVKASTSVAALMELCRSLQEARNTQVRLPQASAALAFPDHLTQLVNH